MITPNVFAITEKLNDTDVIQIGNNIVDAETLINKLLLITYFDKFILISRYCSSRQRVNTKW